MPSTLTSGRFWRSVIALVLAVAAAITSGLAGDGLSGWSTDGPVTQQLVAAGGAVAFCLLARDTEQHRGERGAQQQVADRDLE